MTARARSTTSRLLAVALAVALAGSMGCTRIWPFNRGASSAAAAAASTPVATGGSDSGLKATISNVKERRGSLVLTLALGNGSAQPIEFRNPVSLRVAGFKVAADGREGIGADGGKLESKRAPVAQLKELKPGAKTELEVRYTFDPALAHEVYPWSMTISNLWIGEQPLADITLSFAPPSGAK